MDDVHVIHKHHLHVVGMVVNAIMAAHRVIKLLDLDFANAVDMDWVSSNFPIVHYLAVGAYPSVEDIISCMGSVSIPINLVQQENI